MANLQSAFNQFHRQIALTSGNKIILGKAMEAIRNKICLYFRDVLHIPAPKFRSQGAYALNTIVNPINGEINLNDGIYLNHLDTQDDGTWPTGISARQWIVDAFNGNRHFKIIQKRACVRLRYGGLYNVDLPIYGLLRGQSRMALKNNDNWINSDPHAIIKWFNSYFSLYGDQLLRIIRFIKAWADHQSLHEIKMPNGFFLSVLATCHYQDDLRDDVAMAYTFKVMSKAIVPHCPVLNPVDINEELTEHFSQSEIHHFRYAIKWAAEQAICATRIDDIQEASMIWRKLFGNRFPIIISKDHVCTFG